MTEDKPKRKATGAFAKGSPHNKPPKALGSQGVGQGDGWGGEANGTRHADKIVPGARNSQSIRDKAQRVEALKDLIYDLAHDAENEQTRLAAARAYLDREEGTPVQRVINTNVDMTPEEAETAAVELLERARQRAERGTVQ